MPYEEFLKRGQCVHEVILSLVNINVVTDLERRAWNSCARKQTGKGKGKRKRLSKQQ